MMLRTAMLAACLVTAVGMPTFAQGYGEPPPGYMAGPPGEWDREQSWRERRAEERHAFWERWRHANWRCEHGDRDACAWLRVHQRG